MDDGMMVGDSLEGNLYVRFGGDPKLTLERLWSTLRELKSMGINRIEGDLVLDGSYFRVDGGFPTFEDNGDNPHAPFLVEPHALLTNLNVFHFQFAADAAAVADSRPFTTVVVALSAATPCRDGYHPMGLLVLLNHVL